MIVDTVRRHLTVRGMVECDPDFGWRCSARSTSTGCEICTFPAESVEGPTSCALDRFTRLYPNRVLACCVAGLSPRWLPREWEVMEAHPS